MAHRVAAALLLAHGAVGKRSSPPPIPTTFGNGIAGFSICEQPTVVLNHTLGPNSSYGLMNHFWTTGGDTIDSIIIEYFIDDEVDPSLSFTPAMACGQGFPAAMTSDPVSVGGLFSAGPNMGKAAPQVRGGVVR
jgi:hypothetical protein